MRVGSGCYFSPLLAPCSPSPARRRPRSPPTILLMAPRRPSNRPTTTLARPIQATLPEIVTRLAPSRHSRYRLWPLDQTRPTTNSSPAWSGSSNPTSSAPCRGPTCATPIPSPPTAARPSSRTGCRRTTRHHHSSRPTPRPDLPSEAGTLRCSQPGSSSTHCRRRATRPTRWTSVASSTPQPPTSPTRSWLECPRAAPQSSTGTRSAGAK